MPAADQRERRLLVSPVRTPVVRDAGYAVVSNRRSVPIRKMATLCLMALLTCSGIAFAGVDVNFGANVHAGDDASLFVSISAQYFDRESRDVEDWQRRCYPNPDDLAVALFLSSNGDRDPDYMFGLRKQGLGWFEISTRCNVPVGAFFLSLGRDPGPPYGKAYGHWRKYRRDKRHVMKLSDDDIRHLVGARLIHEYYDVPLETAMKSRAAGRDVRSVMVREYRSRHGGRERARADSDSGQGKGPAKPETANPKQKHGG
jgi:hypothetical protein